MTVLRPPFNPYSSWYWARLSASTLLELEIVTFRFYATDGSPDFGSCSAVTKIFFHVNEADANELDEQCTKALELKERQSPLDFVARPTFVLLPESTVVSRHGMFRQPPKSRWFEKSTNPSPLFMRLRETINRTRACGSASCAGGSIDS